MVIRNTFALFFLFFVSRSLLLPAHAQDQTGLPPKLDAYIQQVLDAFQVPGVSVGIVKDGKLLMAKGYGVKKLGDADRVDENTLFCIASNSKAFTATALAMLVEEGKLKWEDRVIDHLPWFRMSDHYVTASLTIRDLLVHHSGLPAYANDLLLFPPSQYTRKELIEKLKDVPLRYDFRSVYAYDNILYVVAGEVVGAVSGQPWEDFVRQRIFTKVGMTNTISRFSTLKQQPNVAYSHVREKSSIKPVETFYDLLIGDAGNPAGGIASSAADMSRWLITQLDSGQTPDAGRLFSPSGTQELWKIVRPMPIEKEPDWLKPAQKDFYGYALGFRAYDHRGHKVVGHGGLLRGFVSQIAMVPDLRLGIVVLTNQQTTGAYWAIINKVLDYYIGADEFDWLGGYKRSLDSALARSASRDSANQPQPDTTVQPTLSLAQYAGFYKNELAGNAVLRKVGQAYELQFTHIPLYNGTVTPFRGDIFRLRFLHPERQQDAYLHVDLNANKSVKEIWIETQGDGDFNGLSLKPVSEAVIDTMDLKKKIEEALKTYPGATVGIAFKDLSTGESFFQEAHRSFHAASTMKTPVLVEVFKQASNGKFSINDSIVVHNRFKSIVDGSLYSLNPKDDSETDLYERIGEKLPISNLLFRMITKSSNLATNMMIDLVGPKQVNKTMQGIGVRDMKVLRGVEDSKAFEKGLNNVTNAYDLMLLFQGLAEGSLVNQEACDEMIAILMNQHFKDKIPALLPADVRTATKTGNITGINHDSGIIILPDGRRYVLVLLSEGFKTSKEAANALSAISRILYDYSQTGIKLKHK